MVKKKHQSSQFPVSPTKQTKTYKCAQLYSTGVNMGLTVLAGLSVDLTQAGHQTGRCLHEIQL